MEMPSLRLSPSSAGGEGGICAFCAFSRLKSVVACGCRISLQESIPIHRDLLCLLLLTFLNADGGLGIPPPVPRRPVTATLAFPRIPRIFAENHRKCLFMNNLQLAPEVPD
jgi:hypothetical protein